MEPVFKETKSLERTGRYYLHDFFSRITTASTRRVLLPRNLYTPVKSLVQFFAARGKTHSVTYKGKGNPFPCLSNLKMNNVNEIHSPFLIFISAQFQLKHVFREGRGERVTCRDSKLTNLTCDQLFFFGGGGGGGGGGERRREKGEGKTRLSPRLIIQGGREGMITGYGEQHSRTSYRSFSRDVITF